MKLPVCDKCGQAYMQDGVHKKCPHCQQVLDEAIKQAWFSAEHDEIEFSIREKTDLEYYVENLISKVPRYRDVKKDDLGSIDELPIGDRGEFHYSTTIAIDLLSSHIQNLHAILNQLEQPTKLRAAKPPSLTIKDLRKGDIISIWLSGQRSRYYVRDLTEDIVYGLRLKANDQIDKRSARSIYRSTQQFSQKQIKMGRIERRGVNANEVGIDGNTENLPSENQ